MRGGGGAFLGRANRVVYPGASTGDGGLFLDARLGARVGADGLPGFDLYAGAFAGDVIGNDRVVLPGQMSASAWYGYWNDLNDDGAIDDLHDTVADPSDEFVWRGLGLGGATPMAYFATPTNSLYGFGAGDPGRVQEYVMVDRTSRTNAVQEWVGSYSPANTDGGFLASIQIFTLAGARTAIGGGLKYDLDDPAALYDVDSYQSVSADAESLWSTATRGVDGTRAVIVDAFWETADIAGTTVLAPLFALRDEVVGAAGSPPTTPAISSTTVFDVLTPWDAKEPNTPWDDFDGRAIYGGVGDPYGSFNTYPGYVDGFHFFHDARPRLVTCGGGYARVPGAGTELRAEMPICFEYAQDPVALHVLGARSTAALLTFKDEVFLWRDVNGDGDLGPVCDPNDPAEFDAERNTCAPEYHSRNKYAFFAGNTELISVCRFTDAAGGLVSVVPVDGDWPLGTVLIKDYRDTTRVAFDLNWEPLIGDTPAFVRWNDVCESNAKNIDSADGILFASMETMVPLRVESFMSIASFVDVSKGIENGHEHVRDVDVLAGFL